MRLSALIMAGLLAAAGTAEAAGPPAFAVCSSCHAVQPGDQEIGPSLYGVIGRKAGSVPDFDYSAAMKKAGFVWTPARLDAFLAAPQKVVPGNKMPYPGMSDPKARAAVVGYLATLK